MAPATSRGNGKNDESTETSMQVIQKLNVKLTKCYFLWGERRHGVDPGFFKGGGYLASVG